MRSAQYVLIYPICICSFHGKRHEVGLAEVFLTLFECSLCLNCPESSTRSYESSCIPSRRDEASLDLRRNPAVRRMSTRPIRLDFQGINKNEDTRNVLTAQFTTSALFQLFDTCYIPRRLCLSYALPPNLPPSLDTTDNFPLSPASMFLPSASVP